MAATVLNQHQLLLMLRICNKKLSFNQLNLTLLMPVVPLRLLFFLRKSQQKVMLFQTISGVFVTTERFTVSSFFFNYFQSRFCCCSLHCLLLSVFSDAPRTAGSISSKASLLPLCREMITSSPLFRVFFFPLLLSSHSLFLLISVLFQHNFCLSASVSHWDLTLIILTSLLPPFSLLPPYSQYHLHWFLYLCSVITWCFLGCISESLLFSSLVRASSNLCVTGT